EVEEAGGCFPPVLVISQTSVSAVLPGCWLHGHGTQHNGVSCLLMIYIYFYFKKGYKNTIMQIV
ncbi:hypothetical protein V4Y02_23910, partial [Escherichia coli]